MEHIVGFTILGTSYRRHAQWHLDGGQVASTSTACCEREPRWTDPIGQDVRVHHDTQGCTLHAKSVVQHREVFFPRFDSFSLLLCSTVDGGQSAREEER